MYKGVWKKIEHICICNTTTSLYVFDHLQTIMAYSIQLRYLWHFLTHVLAIYLFTSGFFITRFELKHLNVCSKLPTEAHVNDNNNNGKNNNNKCWIQPRFKKAVIIIIDALRDDFARFDESLSLIHIWIYDCI